VKYIVVVLLQCFVQNRVRSELDVRYTNCVLFYRYCDKLSLIAELPKITVLQSSTVTRTGVIMEQYVRKMLHISHTSANVHLPLPANTVKLVNSVIVYLAQLSVVTYGMFLFRCI